MGETLKSKSLLSHNLRLTKLILTKVLVHIHFLSPNLTGAKQIIRLFYQDKAKIGSLTLFTYFLI